jgi:uncharacterized lipoprotein NlpE involved in copper resistance
MSVYLANAEAFTECLTGKRFPVVEGDHAALEAAYGQARRKPGELILITLKIFG